MNFKLLIRRKTPLSSLGELILRSSFCAYLTRSELLIFLLRLQNAEYSIIFFLFDCSVQRWLVALICSHASHSRSLDFWSISDRYHTVQGIQVQVGASAYFFICLSLFIYFYYLYYRELNKFISLRITIERYLVRIIVFQISYLTFVTKFRQHLLFNKILNLKTFESVKV